MGFTLDGVPLGDMTYGNHNGLHISRAIPTELVERVTLSQGTGSLATASTSNLGGAIQFFFFAEPLSELGVDLAQTLGTDDAARTFVRFDTGQLGDAGPMVMLTYADNTTRKWKGGADQEAQMYNVKLVQPIDEGAFTFFYDVSDRAEIDYQDLSKDITGRRGLEWDNYYPDWNAAIAAADGCGTSGTSGPFSTTEAGFNAIRDVVQPKKATNFKAGNRFRPSGGRGARGGLHGGLREPRDSAGPRHRRQPFRARQRRQRRDERHRNGDAADCFGNLRHSLCARTAPTRSPPCGAAKFLGNRITERLRQCVADNSKD